MRVTPTLPGWKPENISRPSCQQFFGWSGYWVTIFGDVEGRRKVQLLSGFQVSTDGRLVDAPKSCQLHLTMIHVAAMSCWDQQQQPAWDSCSFWLPRKLSNGPSFQVSLTLTLTLFCMGPTSSYFSVLFPFVIKTPGQVFLVTGSCTVGSPVHICLFIAWPIPKEKRKTNCQHLSVQTSHVNVHLLHSLWSKT